MLSAQVREQLDTCLALLKARRDGSASRREISEIVQQVLNSLRGDVSAQDIRLHQELEALVAYIREAKREIAALRPDDIPRQHIPLATDELDAIVAATEEATGTILDCAETIEETAKSLDPEHARALEQCVTRVYEACNFQDITGQRITKVVKTLKHIEERINFIVAALGGASVPAAPDAAEPSAEPRNEDLLNGPQPPENAITQDHIDALLSR